ncbi:membrane-associated protein, putative [Bodo saltans]|uniref:Membrane-associated protein, putative n=1 Tax=Bodo saltans TaxID=75058 RepID=A0A0S4IWC1_BODSA|nr:membrane-associated protein, putative [Bodo saltans]|eukprot:CUG27672.1 membrane-associated protein, putative [Bodo saltans]
MVTLSGCVSNAHCWVYNIFIVVALLTTSITAEGGSGGDGSSEILGMTTGVAILVLVLVAFVVIGCLLCVLHRQLQIMKATRRRTHIQEMRRANRSHDDDDDDEGELSASSGPAPTDTYKSPAIPTTDKVIIVNAELSVSTPPSASALLAGRDGPSQEQEINDTDDHVNALPLLQQHSPKASSAGKPLRFGGGGDVEEGTDSHTLQHSVRKVGSWLSHSAQLLPPLGTPQFMNLRASSFLGIPPAPSAATSQADDGSAVVYVRVNSRQRRSNTMPIRVPPSATGGVPDPFGDIPIVSMEETYPRPTTTSGGGGRMVRRSVSLDSQNSDPFS